MASKPVETCWILPQTPDGVDDGEIIQKEWSISLGSKLKANQASQQTSLGPRHLNSQLFFSFTCQTTNASRLHEADEANLLGVLFASLVEIQHHRLSILFATAFSLFVLRLALESLRVTVAEGLSSASSAIVFIHTAVISISSPISIYGNSLGFFGPPFCAWPPKSLIRHLSLGSHGRM